MSKKSMFIRSRTERSASRAFGRTLSSIAPPRGGGARCTVKGFTFSRSSSCSSDDGRGAEARGDSDSLLAGELLAALRARRAAAAPPTTACSPSGLLCCAAVVDKEEEGGSCDGGMYPDERWEPGPSRAEPATLRETGGGDGDGGQRPPGERR